MRGSIAAHVELGLERRGDAGGARGGERALLDPRLAAERARGGHGRRFGRRRHDAPLGRGERAHAGDVNLDAAIAREAVGRGALVDGLVRAAAFDLDARRRQRRAQIVGHGLCARGGQRVVVRKAIAVARRDRRAVGVADDLDRELAHAAPLGRDALELGTVARI